MESTAATGQHTTSADSQAVALWLFSVAALVFLMIVVGGATRLTDSGLSITEWRPIMGAIPPLSDADWQDAFAKYQQIPEYTHVNKGMSLEAFKLIFWWEWGHRFLGRFIGVAFALPLAVFWWQGRLGGELTRKLLAVLALGALQGAVGWYMVSSGLVDRVDVSQYRLALHLGLAFLILGTILWLALGLWRTGSPAGAPSGPGQYLVARLLLATVFIQVLLGALVAGLKAGLAYNTWPDMNGALLPPGLGELSPWHLNLFDNVTMVQFNHRLVAYGVAAMALWHAFSMWRRHAAPPRRSALLVAGAVLAQVGLGIWTLLAGVPLPLGLAHQAGAALVFMLLVSHVHLLARAEKGRP